MAEGPIPWSSIDRFARRHRVKGEDFDVLVSMVRALDHEYFLIKSEEAEAATGKPPKPKGG